MIGTAASILNRTGSVGLALIYWVIGFVMAAAGICVYLELAGYFPNRSGSEVVYLEQQYPRPKHFFPITFAVQSVLLNFGSSNAIVLARYAWRMTLKEPTEWQVRGVAIAPYSLAIIFAGANNKWSLWASNFIGALKLLTLLFISITGLVVLGGHVKSIPNPTANFHNAFEGATANGNDLASALVSIVFSYTGYSNAFNVVNEIKNPILTLKKNTSVALLAVVVLYIFCNIAYFAVVPKDEFKEASEIAASIFFTKLFGESRTAANVLNFMVLLSAFGNLLAVLIGNSRMIREIGRQGVLPFTEFWVSTKPSGTPLGPCLLNFAVTIIMIIALPAGDAFAFVVSLQTYPSALFNFAMAIGVFVLCRHRKRSGLVYGEFKAWDVMVIFWTVVQMFVLAMPWWPPKGGPYAGDVGFWYATYCVVGIGILLLYGIYYLFWVYLLPRWGGYVILSELIEVGTDGANTHRLLKIPKAQIGQWDRHHDEAGKLHQGNVALVN
ncbi:High-affinity methionine permease [Fusarium keratoplasticum]|uniref:High-affinity methionine permease n=1 Tax=Fusarium keratoplasticum TaxID=1328300 RepID=A0ACC0QLD6_9HYPO|nr:High-affinity methionine permease [Fusarium keratoplasticum]KAI8657852.1 High-affinity methionine permease [Fusarium keratoplasticum]